jgi:hypothetical protein
MSADDFSDAALDPTRWPMRSGNGYARTGRATGWPTIRHRAYFSSSRGGHMVAAPGSLEAAWLDAVAEWSRSEAEARRRRRLTILGFALLAVSVPLLAHRRRQVYGTSA